MMVILRLAADGAPPPALPVKLRRNTPDAAGKTDHFCVVDPAAIAALREAGHEVVDLRDGWYADDSGGGVAIWSQGKYWEVRDTPFTVREASGPTAPAVATGDREHVEVRGAIFGVPPPPRAGEG